jgi:hypothetical protein
MTEFIPIVNQIALKVYRKLSVLIFAMVNADIQLKRLNKRSARPTKGLGKLKAQFK